MYKMYDTSYYLKNTSDLYSCKKLTETTCISYKFNLVNSTILQSTFEINSVWNDKSVLIYIKKYSQKYLPIMTCNNEAIQYDNHFVRGLYGCDPFYQRNFTYIANLDKAMLNVEISLHSVKNEALREVPCLQTGIVS